MTTSVLWYREPAARWVEALPLGNGRLGAMVFGCGSSVSGNSASGSTAPGSTAAGSTAAGSTGPNVGSERWQLNEDSLWTGGPEDADNPSALPALEAIRQLLLAGRHAEAQRLADATQIRKPSTHGQFGSYTTLGELQLEVTDGAAAGPALDYHRELDLASAVAATRYRIGHRTFTRECFVSHPDQVLVIAIRCSERAQLDFRLTLARPGAHLERIAEHTLSMFGRLRQRDADDGMRYAAQLSVVNSGGRVNASDREIRVERADSVLILVAAATNYRSPELESVVAERIAQARTRDYAVLLERHMDDHAPRFERVRLTLASGSRSEANPSGPGSEKAASELPTDERLLRHARGQSDPGLIALYFQLGRYLLCASSRPGTLAANLQGIWADGLENPWNGDYHTNINVQMNYWLAETCNLAECAEPLLDLIENMRQPGRQTARVHYGARGWVVHTVHNVWGFTSPGEKPLWGLFPMATAWLCQHVWEHYAFGRDLDYLRSAWPCLREAAQFCLDWLVRDPATGKLVSGPASSPENTFLTANGEPASICMGPSMDQELLWEHLGNVLEAAKALGIEDRFVQQVTEARHDLALPQIGEDGRVMEWPLPFQETEPEHRHISHLFGLHPGRRLTPERTPEACRAARRSLERRGDASTGWSSAWKACCWARLGDGDRALSLLRKLLTPVRLDDSEFAADGPGVYPNLFCAHPPFQIDGNFGGAAAVAELLLQSHAGELSLLPALPAEWASGSVSGLCARGGFVVELSWSQGRLTRARVHSTRGGDCHARYRGRVLTLGTVAGESYDLTAQLCGSPTQR